MTRYAASSRSSASGRFPALILSVLVLAVTCGVAEAGHYRHRHRAFHLVHHGYPVPRGAESVGEPQADVRTAHYPEFTPGGVPGNLPFNNQLRKLSDPLNANGR